MLTENNKPKIIDFGMANSTNPSAGTPHYQAPELMSIDYHLNIYE